MSLNLNNIKNKQKNMKFEDSKTKQNLEKALQGEALAHLKYQFYKSKLSNTSKQYEQAFDELDTERSYHQEKRKEANERLIARKGRIGKLIGFAPMIALFVGYLIIPLVAIGLLNMTNSFTTMSSMM